VVCRLFEKVTSLEHFLSVGASVEGGLGISQYLKGELESFRPKENSLILTLPLFITNLVSTVLIGYKAW